jgi:8-oxo-dGTP pyrophosphatase MutT (NUDIX family)
LDTISCGGVVIYKGKALILYRSRMAKFDGWVLPKGKKEFRESDEDTALREVREETGAKAKVVRFLGKTRYNFQGDERQIYKTVVWFLMSADSFYCKPQAEEHFADAGFYKRHEAYHLLKYPDEREVLSRAFSEFGKLRRARKWR